MTKQQNVYGSSLCHGLLLFLFQKGNNKQQLEEMLSTVRENKLSMQAKEPQNIEK